MKLYVALCAMLIVFSGCSGGEDAEEPVKAEKESDATDEASDEAKLADAEKDKGDGTAEAPSDEDEAAVEEVAPDTSAPMTAAEPTGFNGPKVWKYVTSFALNVRGAPDKVNSTVIRHVKWGDKVEVVINGEWAKLGAGEYISSKHLSDTDPALRHSKSSKGKKGKKKGK